MAIPFHYWLSGSRSSDGQESALRNSTDGVWNATTARDDALASRDGVAAKRRSVAQYLKAEHT